LKIPYKEIIEAILKIAVFFKDRENNKWAKIKNDLKCLKLRDSARREPPFENLKVLMTGSNDHIYNKRRSAAKP